MTHTEGKCKVDIIWIQFCHHEFWSRNDHWEIWQWLWMPLSWSWILGRVFCQSFLKDLAVQVNHVSWPVQTWWDWRLHWSSWLQSWANVGADMVGVEVECLPVCFWYRWWWIWFSLLFLVMIGLFCMEDGTDPAIFRAPNLALDGAVESLGRE